MKKLIGFECLGTQVTIFLEFLDFSRLELYELWFIEKQYITKIIFILGLINKIFWD